MNFLAHLWLTHRAGLPLAGALLGDYLRGPISAGLPEPLARSVRLHRRVDAVTDRHPLVQTAKARFAPGARRYAGIVLDIAYDHCLALDWAQHSDEPLARFADRAAAEIGREKARFEQAGGRAPDPGAFSQLLQSYVDVVRVDDAIRRTATRLSRPQGLVDAMVGWRELKPELRAGLPGLLQALEREAQAFS